MDVIVIGSGMGGMVAGALLARCEDLRVLVLERHFKAGGFTQTFSRPGGFTWDVGVHYVGADVLALDIPRNALNVATGGRIRWRRLPDPFERIMFPGLEFAVRSGRENLQADLSARFPDEVPGIRRWLSDVERVAALARDMVMRGLLPRPLSELLELMRRDRWNLARTITEDYLNACFTDRRLRALVGARWGDCGLPPSQSAFLIHAIITAHYFDGAVYPSGSAATLAEAMTQVIEERGGEVRVRSEVENILVDRGRATGVRLRDGSEIPARWVISDAGARSTYVNLIPSNVRLPFRDTLRSIAGNSAVVLYLGLSQSPEVIGVKGENYWIYDDLDHSVNWSLRSRLLEGQVGPVYVSFPSAKDPTAKAHTGEIIAGVSAEAFARFRRSGWRNRGDEYTALKIVMSDALLAKAEQKIPGLASLVRYRELSTPLSVEHFTAHAGGAIYGVPWTPGRVDMRWLSPRSPIKGLCLAGADAVLPGIGGATMSGVAAAARIGGLGLFRRLAWESRRICQPTLIGAGQDRGFSIG